MKWVTRERPKIDRVACPWLIKKFVDKDAEFLFVPGDKVMSEAKRLGATPFEGGAPLPGQEPAPDLNTARPFGSVPGPQ